MSTDGTFVDYYKCLKNQGIELDAGFCVERMKYIQRKNYRDTTDKKIEFENSVIECLEKHQIGTKFLRCQLHQNKYYNFYEFYDIPFTKYIRKQGSGISDAQCMKYYSEFYYSSLLRSDYPSIDSLMNKSYSDKC